MVHGYRSSLGTTKSFAGAECRVPANFIFICLSFDLISLQILLQGKARNEFDRDSRASWHLTTCPLTELPTMRFSNALCASALSILSLSNQLLSTPIAEASAPVEQRSELWGNTKFVKRKLTIAPKVFIISMVSMLPET